MKAVDANNGLEEEDYVRFPCWIIPDANDSNRILLFLSNKFQDAML